MSFARLSVRTLRGWLAVALVSSSAACATSALPEDRAGISDEAIESIARSVTPADDLIAQIEHEEASRSLLHRELINVAYANTSSAQRLDLWLPSAGAGPFPVVVWIHGGGWERGDRRVRNTPPAEYLLKRGFAVGSIDYRLSSEAVFPAQIADVKAAIRHLRANSASYALDPSRIAVWGESAGGHLAALAGTTGSLTMFDDPALGNVGVSSRVQAVVDFYGPAAFHTFDRDAQEARCARRIAGGDSTASRLIGAPVGANPALAERASPITYVSAAAPPFFVQHGKADCMVPWRQSDALVRALRAKVTSAAVQVRYFDNAEHGGDEFNSDANLEDIVRFLNAAFNGV